MQIRRRPWFPLLSFFVLAAVMSWYHYACAATGAATPGLDAPPIWLVYAGLALGALAGFETVLGGVSAILRAVAPGVRATPDDRSDLADRLATRVDELHDKIDAIGAALKPIVPAPAPVAVLSGTIAKATLIGVLLGGSALLGGGLALSACTTPAAQQIKSEGSAAGSALLDCTKKLGPGQLETGLALLVGEAFAGGLSADTLAAAALADLTEVKTCALAEYGAVTAAKQASAPGTAVQGLTAAAAVPDPIAAALAKVKAARRLTSIVTPGGSI